MTVELPKPDHAHNMRLVSHCDQGGRPDGVQIMVHRGYAYIGHMALTPADIDVDWLQSAGTLLLSGTHLSRENVHGSAGGSGGGHGG